MRLFDGIKYSGKPRNGIFYRTRVRSLQHHGKIEHARKIHVCHKYLFSEDSKHYILTDVIYIVASFGTRAKKCFDPTCFYTFRLHRYQLFLTRLRGLIPWGRVEPTRSSAKSVFETVSI